MVTREHTATRETALLVVAGVLASGLPAALLDARPARIAVGLAITLLLGALAHAATRGRIAPALRDGLLALAVLSVFGWASALISGLPVVAQWLREAPVPLAFLAVNAMKLTSVIPLLVLARRLRVDRREFLVQVGDPGARVLPYLRWPVAAPLVAIAVAAMFLAPLPAAASDRLGALPAWLPVMLLGAGVNAVAEELLYRHALTGTTRRVIGLLPAVALSSAIFGLAHVTGTPGGLSGVLFTAGYGLVCAAAMLQTRGMVWNLAIHVAGDVSAVAALFLAS